MTEQPPRAGALAALDARVTATSADVRERDNLAAKVARLDAVLDEQRSRIAELARQVQDEQRDVERLEGLSFGRVMSTLRGVRTGELEREQAEWETARYRLAEAESQHDLVSAEKERDVDRLAALRGAEQSHAEALGAKEAYLRDTNAARAATLLDIAAQRGRLEADARELDEAIAAARDADRALDRVTERLGSAASWSTYDTWFGGGMISSAVKHDRLDDAQRAASLAESRLSVLRHELSEVGADAEVAPSLDIDRLTRFADIWLDNIFTDLSVASRIGRARDSTDTARRAVRSIIGHLSARRTAIAAHLGDLAAQRELLLTEQ